jgi:phage gpG-like protein
MTDIDAQIREIFGSILKDIQVELGDEFDQNFERQGFFSEKWERRRSPLRPGAALLSGTGNSTLRQSIRSEIRENSIVFISDLPHAAIHNEGGEIVVTEKMKRFFRAKFYESQGGFNRKKGDSHRPTLSNGAFYAWTSKMSLNTISEFWRNMALMKVGSKIRIPQRKFLGTSPEVEAAVRQIIEENLNEYVNNINFNIK